MNTAFQPVDHPPELEILSTTGKPDVAEISVARTRPGDDRSMVEFVDGLDWRQPRERKWIINVSTQYGCPVGCRFCDAAHHFHGNLTADDMLAQVASVISRHPGLAGRCEKLKVHFARMGEPALNDEVLTALCRLPGFVQAPGLWACVATTAPAGRTEWFDSLRIIKDERFSARFQIQFSLNTTDERYRRQSTRVPLMSFTWINDYAARFHLPAERKVVLNFALADGIPFNAGILAERFDPAHVVIKLTPLNPTIEGRENGLSSLSSRDLETHAAELGTLGFETILSIGDPREDQIGSNCGQSVRRMTAESP